MISTVSTVVTTQLSALTDIAALMEALASIALHVNTGPKLGHFPLFPG